MVLHPTMEEDGFVDAGDRIQPLHLLSTIHPASRNHAGVSRAWTPTLGGHRPALRLPAPVPSLRGAGRTEPGGDNLEMTPHPPPRMPHPAVATPAEPREASRLLLPPWESGVELDNWKTENAQQLPRQHLPRVTSDTQPCQPVGQRDVQAATDVQDLTLIASRSGGERRKPKPRIFIWHPQGLAHQDPTGPKRR